MHLSNIYYRYKQNINDNTLAYTNKAWYTLRRSVKVRWCVEKDRVLKYRYGVSFGELMRCRKIGMTPHPTRESQRLMFFEMEGYVWVIPFVENEDEAFLKTFYPSRKYTRLYKEGWFHEKED